METLEKARIALRKYLLANKDRVVADLEDIRKKSEGHDIFNYVERLSNSFSFENVSSCKKTTYDYDFQEVQMVLTKSFFLNF